MASETGCNETLIQQLPLPLAKLYRHASNAKSALDRHQAAYFLWEAALKLLATSAVATAADRQLNDPAMLEQLSSLARPSLGEWRKYVRLLVPWLAGSDESFQAIKSVLDKSRDDLPRAAGLDALLREQLEGKTGARSTVCLNELFDRLVTYRNREVGHGAPGLRDAAFFDRLGRSLLAAVPEMLARIDVLAGRRLLHVADVSRTSSGKWLVDCFELIGESPRRLDAQEIAAGEQSDLLIPGRVYLADRQTGLAGLTPLYPLAIYNTGLRDLLLLNARGKRRCEYLCYSSGDMTQVDELGGQMSEFLTRIFGRPVPVAQVEAWAAQSNSDDSGAPAKEQSGLRSIGEFELMSVLGQGGMGVVYRAWQPSLGRQVALKCLLRTGDAKSAERFAREYRALARVEHPHLVKVYTSGSEGDQWFYAMELIEGVNLADVCEQLQGHASSAADVAPDTWKQAVSTTSEQARRSERPISEHAVAAVESERRTPVAVPPFEVDSYVRHVVELVRQVASALENLHQAGIIHRDIKPGNIMLAGGGSQAVLMDLGLAQWVDKTKLTQTRQFVGTLRYASPEQVLSVGQLDGRSDVYSLGATLWELLTLKPMFGATDEMPTPELMKCIQYEDPPLIEKYNPRIAADLQAVVAKCLQKNPSKRYQTAAELAADLDRWLRDEPVQAQATNWRYRSGKFVHRNRKRLGTALVVLAAQAAVIGGLYYALRPTWDRLKSEEGLGLAATVESDSGESAALVAPRPVRRALLVGCGRYDYLPRQMQSEGPTNDVALARATLQATFGFAADDFVELTDGGDPRHRPTRVNILAALNQLAEDAVAGQDTVIFLSGQSSTLESKGEWGEPILLPADADKYDPATKQVKNAITNTEFRRAIEALVDRHAVVLVVCDLCWPLGWNGDGEAGGIPGAAFIYAGRPGEMEIELPLPPGSKNGRLHGLLTYTLCETLLRAGRPLTYTELMERIYDRYRTMGRTSPNPWVGGVGTGEIVLKDARWSSAGGYLVTAADGDQYTIGGGSLQGLTKGCLLEVLENAGQPQEKKLGILRVVESSDLESQAIPFEYDTIVGDHEPIPVQSQARLVYIDFGDLRLKVEVASVTGQGQWIEGKALIDLQGALSPPVRGKSLFDVTTGEATADWVVWERALDSEEVFIVKPGPIESTKKIGPLPKEKLDVALPKALGNIARASNLLTLARISEGEQDRGHPEAHTTLEMVRLADRSDAQGTSISWRDGTPTLSAGETCGWRIKNLSPFPVDVTLLYIDADYNIASLFPRPGSSTDNRLVEGDSLLAARAKVNAVTTGIEHVILIATRAGEAPIDFSFLESSTIEAARGAVRRGVETTLATPLGLVFQNAFFGEGKQRGLSVREINRFVMSRLSWQVQPVVKEGSSTGSKEPSSSSASPSPTR